MPNEENKYSYEDLVLFFSNIVSFVKLENRREEGRLAGMEHTLLDMRIYLPRLMQIYSHI
jgi:hypothetical protein